jgi:hypothetical protein
MASKYTRELIFEAIREYPGWNDGGDDMPDFEEFCEALAEAVIEAIESDPKKEMKLD